MIDAKMFDGYADAYDQWFMTNSNVFASELKLLHRALHDIEKETILSIGCGSVFLNQLCIDNSAFRLNTVLSRQMIWRQLLENVA